MTKEQQRVRDWMRTFGQATPEAPCIPSREVLELRCRLMLEEVLEFCRAAGFVEAFGTIARKRKPANIFEMVDALADLQFVNLGSAVALGVDLEPVFAEVCRSNDSKLWKLAELEQAPKGCTVTYLGVCETGRCYLVKDTFGKVIKGPSYEPANVSGMIEQKEARGAKV